VSKADPVLGPLDGRLSPARDEGTRP